MAELPDCAAELLERRAATRGVRDFRTSDQLRDELAATGVEVRDTPNAHEITVRKYKWQPSARHVHVAFTAAERESYARSTGGRPPFVRHAVVDAMTFGADQTWTRRL
jgi:hypothetical protein